ncbi:interleukin-6 [Menidia menidia]
MPVLSFRLLSAALLAAALLRGSSGAPPGEAPTDSPAGDTSGEEEEEDREAESPDILTWEKVIAQTNAHQKEFEKEFKGNVNYLFLDNYKHSSFPAECPDSNFSKEACLQRLAQGMLVYSALLRHVEREYPDTEILQGVNASIHMLVPQIKKRMSSSEQVRELSGGQQQRLLQELSSPDAFHRKMTAHSILYHLRLFLIDGKRSFRKWALPKRRPAHTDGSFITFLHGVKDHKQG